MTVQSLQRNLTVRGRAIPSSNSDEFERKIWINGSVDTTYGTELVPSVQCTVLSRFLRLTGRNCPKRRRSNTSGRC
jgi:hypothetical protein